MYFTLPCIFASFHCFLQLLFVCTFLVSLTECLDCHLLTLFQHKPDYHYYYLLLIRVFHISESWWYFTGDWVTAGLQVSRTLLSILAIFNNADVWMVSTRPPTSKSSRPFNNPLVTVQKAPITIGIIVTFMFHSFFQFSSEVKVLISLFTFFQFYSVVSRDSKVDNFADFLFFCWLL